MSVRRFSEQFARLINPDVPRTTPYVPDDIRVFGFPLGFTFDELAELDELYPPAPDGFIVNYCTDDDQT